MQDLKALYGKRYRVRYEQPATTHCQDVWYQIILCRYGHIYQHGDGMLGYASDRRGAMVNTLASLDCCEVTQEGDDGLNVVFPLSEFDRVAQIVRPRKRRTMSPERRAQVAEQLRQWQIQKGRDNVAG